MLSRKRHSRTAPATGIEDAWKELRSELHAFLRARVSSSVTADDLLQDVFLRVQRKGSEIDRIANLRAWLYQITRNVLIDHRRTHDRRPIEALPDLSEKSPDAGREIRERLAPCLRGMITELPPAYSGALQLVELDGMTQADAAKQLGISLTALKSRVRRGRVLLKKLLLDCCHFEIAADGQVQDYWPKTRKVREC